MRVARMTSVWGRGKADCTSAACMHYIFVAHAMADDSAGEYKLILLGDSGVGKSTFFHRIRTGEFLTETMMGRRKRPEERHIHRGKVNGKDVKVVLIHSVGACIGLI